MYWSVVRVIEDMNSVMIVNVSFRSVGGFHAVRIAPVRESPGRVRYSGTHCVPASKPMSRLPASSSGPSFDMMMAC